jgi:hypothetical protein
VTTDYDFEIVRESSIRYVDNGICAVTPNSINVSSPDYVNGNLSIRVSDNQTVSDGGGFGLDYLRLDKDESPFVVSSDSLNWIIFMVLIGGGVVMAAWIYSKWREEN